MIKPIFIIFLLFFTYFIHGSDKIAYLFINSSPIKVKVLINGNETDKLISYLLRDIISDSKITVKKDGFKNYKLNKDDKNFSILSAGIGISEYNIYVKDKNTVYCERAKNLALHR